MDKNENAIIASDLTKYFGQTKALDNFALHVKKGEVHGFLGPNGAGKSTTIRILLGLLRQDSGNVRLLGGDPARDVKELHRRLAYVPGDVNLWPNLTGGEVIDLIARIRGGIDIKKRDSLYQRFDLNPRKKSHTYSKGNRQKVALIAALASNAELLILDEPTAGLDPLMEAVFQECIGEVKAEGRTVLLSSHILAQVEALADRISIIRHGALVESGTLGELRHLTNTVITAATVKPAAKVKELAGVHNITTLDDGRIRFEVEPEHLGPAMNYLTSIGLSSLESHPPTLEQLLLRHYDDELGRQASKKANG